MKRFLIMCAVVACAFTSSAREKFDFLPDDKAFPSLLPGGNESAIAKKWVDSMYYRLRLDTMRLNKDVFFYACKGYQYFLSKDMLNNPDILTICDFSQSSKQKRLYVLDMKKGVVLQNTFVSHGRNSGSEYATSFSNLPNSHKSSQGFMISAETYRGRAGYSLRFDGMEPTNDNVRDRAIVMHGSRYVNEKRADEDQSMGRSYGCPAVPYALHRDIIDEIKGGSCFFSYSSDVMYAQRSQILNTKFEWPVLAKQEGEVNSKFAKMK